MSALVASRVAKSLGVEDSELLFVPPATRVSSVIALVDEEIARTRQLSDLAIANLERLRKRIVEELGDAQRSRRG